MIEDVILNDMELSFTVVREKIPQVGDKIGLRIFGIYKEGRITRVDEWDWVKNKYHVGVHVE